MCAGCEWTTTTRSPPSSTPGGATSIQPCLTSELRLSAGPDVSEATEQRTFVIRLTNRGQTTCFLRGYPTIRLVDGHGNPMRFQITRSGDQMVTSRRPSRVDVRSNGSAFVALNKNSCPDGGSGLARIAYLSLPANPRTMKLWLPLLDWSFCGGGRLDPLSTFHMSPFEPTFADTMAH